MGNQLGWRVDISGFFFRIFFTLLLLFVVTSPLKAEQLTYNQLAPILQKNCVICHKGESAPAGLRLDSLNGLLKGSDKGRVVIAGNPSASELFLRIKGISQPRMPMTGPPWLSDNEIALFERWIQEGLKAGNPEQVTVQESPVKIPQRVTYADVAPIFASRCVKCHTRQGIMGPAPEGYLLTSYRDVLSSFDRARIVPGNPEASELFRKIKGLSSPRMPMDGPPWLTEFEISLIERWIEQGSPDIEGKRASVPTGAKVRLQGTLSSGWQLGNLPLITGNQTRFDKSPAPGDYVEVRGRVMSNGSVRVERIRRR